MQDESRPERVRLIESDEKEPRMRLPAGKRYEVIVTSVVDSDLEAVKEETGAGVRPARLCGSRSTCVAIVEL